MPDLTASSLSHALGLTLVHFLWQGAALAIAAALLLRLARRSTANVRYGIACAALATMTAAPLLTFAHEIGQFASAAVATPIVDARIDGSPGVDTKTSEAADRTAAASWAAQVSGWMPWVVGAWTAGVGISLLRLLVAWLGLRRVRRRARRTLTPALAMALNRVRQTMGLHRPIDVGESTMVTTPTVIGSLRPVLLMPVSLVAGLAPSELESILAHELAHLRRFDHVVNGVQIAVETVLFYHPAVWWISGEIRREREYCCDDAALAVVGNRITYASALASLEERRQHSLALTLAATDGDLLSRVRRILGEPMNARTHAYSMSWAGTTLGLAVAATIAVSAASHVGMPPPRAAGDIQLAPPHPLAANAPQGGSRAEVELARLRLDIAALDSVFRMAVANRNVARLDALLAGNFVSTDQRGIVDTKASFLARTAGGSRFERLSQSVQIDSDTAIVTGTENEIRGTDRERILFTRVWKRAGTAWQLLSSTQFLDPRPAAVPGMASAPAAGQPGRTTAAPPPPLPPMVLPANAVRVGGDIKEPRKVVNTAPIYPAIAKAAKISGVVILEAVIDESGTVANIRVLRGHPMLDPAAIDAVSQWKYTPTTLNGAPVSVVMTLTVNFALADAPAAVPPAQ